MANTTPCRTPPPPPPSDSGWEVGFSKPRRFLLQPQGLVRTRGLGVLLATEERILASLSFLRSGSGFREAAIVGGRAACLPPPPTTLTAPPGSQRASPEGPGPLRRAAPLCAHLAADVGLAERRACPPRRAQQAGWPPGALGRRRRPGPGAPSPWTLGQGRRLSPKVRVRGSTLAAGRCGRLHGRETGLRPHRAGPDPGVDLYRRLLVVLGRLAARVCPPLLPPPTRGLAGELYGVSPLILSSAKHSLLNWQRITDAS